MKARQILLRALLVLFGVLLAFSIVEITLRLRTYSPIVSRDIKYCKGKEKLYHLNRSFWTKTPGLSYIAKFSELDEWSLYHMNSEGFRDTYDQGNRTVLVLGDSQTEGWSVNQNSTFTHLLDRWVPDVRFRNYGMEGYSTSNELILYQQLVNQTEHELVILGYFLGNDALENVKESVYRPDFTIKNNRPVLINQSEDPQETDKNLKEKIEYALKNSYVYNTYMNKLNTKKTEAPWKTPHDRQIRVTSAILEEIGRTVETKNAELMIVIIPPKGEIMDQNTDKNPPELAKTYGESQRQMIKNIAKNNSDIFTIDLKNYFNQSDRLYGTIDPHLNEKGHRKIAKIVYKKLSEKSLIKNRSPDFEKKYDKPFRTCP